GRLLAGLAAAEGDVGLESEDGPDPALLGSFIEGPGAVEVAVIGDGERVHAERLDPVEEIRNPVRAVEQGVFAVGVEVDERHRVAGYRALRSSSSKTRSRGSRRASSR